MTRGRYSPNGAYPQDLPDRWRFPDGTVRTDLQELTDEELAELGWFGPIQEPPFPGTSYYTHNFDWNSETLSFDAIELDQYEKMTRIDYNRFWIFLLRSSAYTKIKSIASQSLLVNTIITEFIVTINDARYTKFASVEKIQELLFEIMENIIFTQEELEEIQFAFMDSGMFAIYSLEPPTE